MIVASCSIFDIDIDISWEIYAKRRAPRTIKPTNEVPM